MLQVRRTEMFALQGYAPFRGLSAPRRGTVPIRDDIIGFYNRQSLDPGRLEGRDNMHPRRLVFLSVSCALMLALGSVSSMAGVIINEIDYDQPSTDSAEWIELHNPDAAPQSLAGMELVLINGFNCTEYRRLDLDPITIPGGGYVVIGNHACATALVVFPGATNQIQNGAPDVVVIEDRNTGATIDSVEYENSGPSACGYAPTSATDSPTDPTGSIQRCPGGWLFDTSTPCSANNCPVPVEGSSWGSVKSLYQE